MTNHKLSSRLVSVYRFMFGNWASRAYLLAVLSAAVFLVVDLLNRNPADDASFAGVYLLAATLPGSALASWLAGPFSGVTATTVFFAAIILSVAANTALLSAVVHVYKSKLGNTPARQAPHHT